MARRAEPTAPIPIAADANGRPVRRQQIVEPQVNCTAKKLHQMTEATGCGATRVSKTKTIPPKNP
jgi:hypothetical protein